MFGYIIKLTEEQIIHFKYLKPEFFNFPPYKAKYPDPSEQQYSRLFVFCGWAAFAAGMHVLKTPMSDHHKLSMQKIQDETDTDLMLGTFATNPQWAPKFDPNLQHYLTELELKLIGEKTNNTAPIPIDRQGNLPYFLKIKYAKGGYDVSLQREGLSSRLSMSGQFFIDIWSDSLIFRDEICYKYFQQRQIYTPELEETIKALVIDPKKFEDRFPARKLEAIIKNMIRLRLIGWTLSEHDKKILTPWVEKKDETFSFFLQGLLLKLQDKIELKTLLKENGFDDCWMDILVKETTYESVELIKYFEHKTFDDMMGDIQHLISQDLALYPFAQKKKIFNKYVSEINPERVKFFLSNDDAAKLLDQMRELVDKTENPLFFKILSKKERVSSGSSASECVSSSTGTRKNIQFSEDIPAASLIKIEAFKNEIEDYKRLDKLEKFFVEFFNRNYLDKQRIFSAQQVKPDYGLFGACLLSLSWVVYDDLLRSKSLSILLFLAVLLIFFMQILGLRINYAQNVNKSLSKIYLEQAKESSNGPSKNQNFYAALVCLLLDMARNKIAIDIQLEDGKASVTQKFFKHLFEYASQFLSKNETDSTIKKLVLNLIFISQEDHETKGREFFTDSQVRKRYSNNGLKNDVHSFEHGLQDIIQAICSKKSEKEIIHLMDGTFSHLAWAIYRKKLTIADRGLTVDEENDVTLFFRKELEKIKDKFPLIYGNLQTVYHATINMTSKLVPKETNAAEIVLVLNKPFWCLFAIQEHKPMLGEGGMMSFLWSFNQERAAYFEKGNQNAKTSSLMKPA